MGVARLFRALRRSGRAGLLHPAAAAQRHRHPAHGARVPADADGRADPLSPHARLRHQLGGRHRPRRHRHADRGRAPARGRGQDPPRSRARRNSSSACGNGSRSPARPSRARCAAWAPPANWAYADTEGQTAGYFTMDDENVARRRRSVRAPARGRPDLPRQAAGELGSGARHRGVRPGSRQRGGRRQDLGNPLSVRRRQRRAGGRHDAARNHARRRCRRGQSQATSATRRWSANKCSCR